MDEYKSPDEVLPKKHTGEVTRVQKVPVEKESKGQVNAQHTATSPRNFWGWGGGEWKKKRRGRRES